MTSKSIVSALAALTLSTLLGAIPASAGLPGAPASLPGASTSLAGGPPDLGAAFRPSPLDLSVSFQDNDDAVAQDDEEEEDKPSVRDEKRDVVEGKMDDKPGVKSEQLALESDGVTKANTIKVLQKKNFLKIGRIEVGPHLGFVTNDPFINRYLIGFNGSYHVTEVLSVELAGTFSPDFGQGDWKPITEQLVNNNNVSPDISKVIWILNGTTQFSPIYGKLAVIGGRIIVFDLYGIFGFGLTGTQDDLDAIQCDGPENDPCRLTASQIHPTTTMGAGFRVAFNKTVAARIEGRSLSFIETLNGTSLEMKNNFMLQVAGTFFFDVGSK
jgi:outer membrane beta-barrel protein